VFQSFVRARWRVATRRGVVPRVRMHLTAVSYGSSGGVEMGVRVGGWGRLFGGVA
jgi:hypothetical protein